MRKHQFANVALAAALAISMPMAAASMSGCQKQGSQQDDQEQAAGEAGGEDGMALKVTKGNETRTYIIDSQEAAQDGGYEIAWGKAKVNVTCKDGTYTCTYKGKTATCCDGEGIEDGKVSVCFDPDFVPPASQQTTGQSSDGNSEDMSGCTSPSCGMRSGGSCNCSAGSC